MHLAPTWWCVHSCSWLARRASKTCPRLSPLRDNQYNTVQWVKMTRFTSPAGKIFSETVMSRASKATFWFVSEATSRTNVKIVTNVRRTSWPACCFCMLESLAQWIIGNSSFWWVSSLHWGWGFTFSHHGQWCSDLCTWFHVEQGLPQKAEFKRRISMECLSPSAQVVEAVPAKLSNESETLTGRSLVHIMQKRLF